MFYYKKKQEMAH